LATAGVFVTGPRFNISCIDPLADIALIADPVKNFRIIMKDGEIHKNTLSTR
jgi:hypothetical protein